MVVLWVMLPEVAVIVTCWMPLGVPGVLGVDGAAGAEAAGAVELEQPMARPLVTSRSTRMPSNWSGFDLPGARLREKTSTEPKGRKAAAMVATPSAQGLRCWRFAMLAAV